MAYRIKHADSYIFTGLIFCTVYAEFFSLFHKVGLLANIVLIAIAIVFFAVYSKQMLGHAKRWIYDLLNRDSENHIRMLLLIALFFFFAYGTAMGILHYDTGLYHAQSIRWIEEYGVVKGIANLHCRLAYNSASFVLSALFSMSFLGGQSFHCCAGFLALLLAKICLEILDSLSAKKIRVSDFARIMLIYYLARVYDEMISPSADYFIVMIAFYIVIRWMDLASVQEKELFPYSMLCVAGAFLVTVKLSAALIVLLVILPAYYLIKQKRIREIVCYLGMGVLVVIPYLIRNVIISGWLVYPVTSVDFFDVPWKVPSGIAEYDAKEVRVWGRGYTDVTRFDVSISEWLPEWFFGLAAMDKLMVIMSAVGTVILVLCLVIHCTQKRRNSLSAADLVGVFTVAASSVFLICTSPMIRYGCVYFYLTATLTFGSVYCLFRDCREKPVKVNRLWRPDFVILLLICVFIVYKIVAVGIECIDNYTGEFWVWQKDYENYDVTSCEINGNTIYYPVEGDRVGYDSFPSAPRRPDVGMFGSTIEDGFYATIK